MQETERAQRIVYEYRDLLAKAGIHMLPYLDDLVLAIAKELREHRCPYCGAAAT